MVLITPALRRWAEGSFGQALELTCWKYLAVLIAVPLLGWVALVILRVWRPLRMLVVALIFQLVALWGVERADGYQLPLWLDLAVAVIAWSTAWTLVSRR